MGIAWDDTHDQTAWSGFEQLASQRCNRVADPVRLIGVRIDTGREITLLTNDLEATAAEIATFYKARWHLDLPFKWTKQSLNIGRFFGTSRNAATNQIMAALIAYLLLPLAQVRCQAALGLQAIARLMPAFALAGRPLQRVLDDREPPTCLQTFQMELVYA